MGSIARNSFLCFMLSTFTVTFAGCANLSHAERGAFFGSGLGGLAGGIIGHQSGRTAGGAMLGTLAGGLAGGLMGDAKDDREERDAAMVYQAEQARRYAELALTNADLVKMSQAGLGEDVIIQSVKSRGGRFDLSPDAMIQLKTYGVSDRVILEVQKSGNALPSTTVVPAGGTIVATPRPQIVVVRPATRVGVVIGRPVPPPVVVYPGHRGWRYRHHHHW